MVDHDRFRALLRRPPGATQSDELSAFGPVDPMVLRVLAERTLESLRQLSDIRRLSLPRPRYRQIDALTENGQLYLVFLEELAQGEARVHDVNVGVMLETINKHCLMVRGAFDGLTRDAGLASGGAN